jgi:hypothetical protein
LNRQFLVEAREVMALAEQGRHDDTLARFRSSAGPTGVTLTTVSSEWIQYNKDLGTNAARAAREAIESTRAQVLTVNVVALGLSGLIGFLTYRRIVTPIQALERSVKTVAPATTRSRSRLPMPGTRPAASRVRSKSSNEGRRRSTSSGGSSRASRRSSASCRARALSPISDNASWPSVSTRAGSAPSSKRSPSRR